MIMDDKKVICKDIKGNLSEVLVNELSFRPSVYGVIINEGKILLSRQWDGYDFPGGKIELGETIEEALIREVKEETGLEVNVGKIVACENSFFKLAKDGKPVQSILIYYLCSVTGGKISNDYLSENEKNYANTAEWMELSQIEKIKFYNSIDSIKIIKEIL